jgi:hypothetical protein
LQHEQSDVFTRVLEELALVRENPDNIRRQIWPRPEDSQGRGNRETVVKRTPRPAPILSNLIFDAVDHQKGNDLPVLFRQRSQAILDPGKQGSLNLSPNGTYFQRTSLG